MNELRLIEILQVIVRKLPDDSEWPDHELREISIELEKLHFDLEFSGDVGDEG